MQCLSARADLRGAVRAGSGADARRGDGSLFCADCRRFYFIVEGIARLLTEDFGELIDLSVPEGHLDPFGARTSDVQAFRRPRPRRTAGGRRRRVERRGRRLLGGDMLSGGRASRFAAGRCCAARCGRPHVSSRARDLQPATREIAGGVIVDLGMSGSKQFARSAARRGRLRLRRRRPSRSAPYGPRTGPTLRRDFIQSAAERMPFRPDSVDAVVMLERCIACEDHEQALRSAVAAVRPGGLDRARRGGRSPPHHGPVQAVSRAQGRGASAHNESVDPATIDRCLAGGTRCSTGRSCTRRCAPSWPTSCRTPWKRARGDAADDGPRCPVPAYPGSRLAVVRRQRDPHPRSPRSAPAPRRAPLQPAVCGRARQPRGR